MPAIYSTSYDWRWPHLMDKVENTELMKRFILKYNMNDIFTSNMEEHMELFHYKKFDYLVKEDDMIQKLLFLVKGKAKVFTNLSNGKSLLLCFYQNFRVLGDIEVINVKEAVTNVQAIEDTYCIGISYEIVRKYLLEDSKFLRYICSSLGVKLTRCSKNSSINLLYPLENRLASYVYTTGERSKGLRKNTICFSENLMEISELLGTSYRHLLRTLNNLCEKQVLMKTAEGYEVLDEKTLVYMSADLYQ
ncbi:MAG: cyclic nucleotide-binding domain protein [Anaerocolumna sp.]|jgi:CRP-like cAMP-binding protein|nr:cyclic nucleotide-binding domain protein [Anaerocolumna sp.]